MGNNKDTRTFDAIVIGSGISGGWAAKELTGNGLKTLVLERGRDVKHIKDYPTANKFPWEFEYYGGELPLNLRVNNPVISKIFNEESMHFFVKDAEHPYVQKKPFDWIRGYQVGGKSLLWTRQTQRWSDFDFEGPDRDGYAIDWPIRYKDIASWYSHVERFVGINGNKDGIPQLPDGEFLPSYELNCIENHFKQVVSNTYKDRQVIASRGANLSEPKAIHLEQGRGKCQNRNLCWRGCPYGGYFSSNSSTLPWAEKTGNLTLRPFSVVHSIIYDQKLEKATGVRVIDANTKEIIEFYSRIIFVNASAFNSNLILLNSTSSRFPNGLGNDNGLMGKYIAFHNYRGRITAQTDLFKDFTIDGRKPAAAYIPRFRNVFKQETDFLRGYATGVVGHRSIEHNTQSFGNELKSNLLNAHLGPWRIIAGFMGETLPKVTNKVSLDAELKDEWGIPLLNTDISYDDNDEKMLKDFFEQFTEMYTKAGFTNIKVQDTKQPPGLDIHEMGGVRMGNDPKTSLLNKWNQLHSCPNVFVTDGACMTSTSTQNPSLTYMALTARACDHAVKEMKRMNL